MKHEPEETQYQQKAGMFDFERRGGKIAFVEPVEPLQKQIRLSKQCQEVLDRLRLGPATQLELKMIASQYNARIFKLRSLGYRIPKPVQDHEAGISTYHLMEEVK